MVLNNDLSKSNNKNDHLTRPRESPGLNARISRHLPLGVLINNYCFRKSQVRITKDFLFVDLRKKNKFTYFQISTSKLTICITIMTRHDETKLRIICFTKTKWLLLNFQFLINMIKRTQQKIRGQTIDKTVTILNRTKPNQTGRNPLFETAWALYIVSGGTTPKTTTELKINPDQGIIKDFGT